MNSQKNIEFRVGRPQLVLLEELTNANGVSGDEAEIREIILKHVTPLVDEIKVDAMGNLLVIKHASKSDPVKVMLDAHMDEVGFMIVEEDDDGLYQFALVGGGDARQYFQNRWWLARKTAGVIGSKPIHLSEPSEIETTVHKTASALTLAPEGKEKHTRRFRHLCHPLHTVWRRNFRQSPG